MEKKKLKFNLVDVIFLLAVIAGVVFVALRLFKPGTSGRPTGSTETYVVTFLASESADFVTDHLRTGASVSDDYLLELGTLIDFQVGPALSTSAASDGHIVISDKEGYSSVLLMCKVQALDNGYGVTVNGLNLGLGHTMVVRADECKFWVAVYDIQRLSDSPYAGQ